LLFVKLNYVDADAIFILADMSSGFGSRGSTGRCYNMWEDFSSCLKDNKEDISPCKDYRDDYMECLHHRKELQRIDVIRSTASNAKASSHSH